MPALRDIAGSMVAPGKGVPAADESIATMSKRLVAAGVPASETARARASAASYPKDLVPGGVSA